MQTILCTYYKTQTHLGGGWDKPATRFITAELAIEKANSYTSVMKATAYEVTLLVDEESGQVKEKAKIIYKNY